MTGIYTDLLFINTGSFRNMLQRKRTAVFHVFLQTAFHFFITQVKRSFEWAESKVHPAWFSSCICVTNYFSIRRDLEAERAIGRRKPVIFFFRQSDSEIPFRFRCVFFITGSQKKRREYS